MPEESQLKMPRQFFDISGVQESIKFQKVKKGKG
jgi:hypothetical protein